MVSVKDAVESSRAFAVGALGAERTAGLQLEEIEVGKYLERDAWKITLSMLRPNPFAANSLQALAGTTSPYAPRDYKTFLVDRESGEVLSMKIRELVGVD
jgi:hypothetical protein